MTGDHTTEYPEIADLAGVAERLAEISAIPEAWREALEHLDDPDSDWPEPYSGWGPAELADLVEVMTLAASQATGRGGPGPAEREVMNAVVTYMDDHLPPGDPFGLYDGHQVLAAARAYQCWFDDATELADQWLEDAWPGLTSALGSFLNRDGIGRQLVADDPWVYVNPPDPADGCYCFASVHQTLASLAEFSATTDLAGPSPEPQRDRLEDPDPGEGQHQAGAEATIAELRGEVTTIGEHAQEAAGDLDADECDQVDLDNLNIAISSIQAAAERGLKHITRLLAPTPEGRA
jgi:hypothetical protein